MTTLGNISVKDTLRRHVFNVSSLQDLLRQPPPSQIDPGCLMESDLSAMRDWVSLAEERKYQFLTFWDSLPPEGRGRLNGPESPQIVAILRSLDDLRSKYVASLWQASPLTVTSTPPRLNEPDTSKSGLLKETNLTDSHPVLSQAASSIDAQDTDTTTNPELRTPKELKLYTASPSIGEPVSGTACPQVSEQDGSEDVHLSEGEERPESNQLTIFSSLVTSVTTTGVVERPSRNHPSLLPSGITSHKCERCIRRNTPCTAREDKACIECYTARVRCSEAKGKGPTKRKRPIDAISVSSPNQLELDAPLPKRARSAVDEVGSSQSIPDEHECSSTVQVVMEAAPPTLDAEDPTLQASDSLTNNLYESIASVSPSNTTHKCERCIRRNTACTEREDKACLECYTARVSCSEAKGKGPSKRQRSADAFPGSHRTLEQDFRCPSLKRARAGTVEEVETVPSTLDECSRLPAVQAITEDKTPVDDDDDRYLQAGAPVINCLDQPAVSVSITEIPSSHCDGACQTDPPTTDHITSLPLEHPIDSSVDPQELPEAFKKFLDAKIDQLRLDLEVKLQSVAQDVARVEFNLNTLVTGLRHACNLSVLC